MILPLLYACLAQAAIFGADDRALVTPSSGYAEAGRAVAVAVLSSSIEPSPTRMGAYKISPGGFRKYLCAEERFVEQPSLSYACSGFLVAPDLLVTAGHCMVNTGETRDESGMYCSVYGWLFDYQNDESGHTRTDGIPADKYYTCSKILYAVNDEKPPFRDYALVKLDRPVVGRKPLLMASAPVAVGDALSMLGFPLGMPLVSADHARVVFDNPARSSFLTTLDAFGGNSGSVVLNARGEAAGILVGGNPIYDSYVDMGAGCERWNRCDEDGQNCRRPDPDTRVFPNYQGVGSDVQRIAPIRELIQSLP